MEFIHYVVSAITDTIKSTSPQKALLSLCFGYVESIRGLLKTSLFYINFKEKVSPYHLKLILRSSTFYFSERSYNTSSHKVYHRFFKISYFPLTFIKWDKLDLELCSSRSYQGFKMWTFLCVRHIVFYFLFKTSKQY